MHVMVLYYAKHHAPSHGLGCSSKKVETSRGVVLAEHLCNNRHACHGVVLSIMLRRGNNRHVLSIMLRRTCSTHVVSTTTTQYSIRNREFNSCWELASCLVGLQLLHCGDSIVPRPQMLTIFPVPNEAVMPPSRTGCSPATRSDLSIAKKPI